MPLTRLPLTTGVSGTLPDANAPSGSVIQVVSTTKTDTFSSSVGLGANVAVTGLTVNITPSSTSSKIMLFASVSMSGDSSGNNVGQGFSFTKDGSKISGAIGASPSDRNPITVQAANSDVDNDRGMSNPSSLFLDSPSTTSEVTYGISIAHTFGGTVTLYVNRALTDTDNGRHQRATSTITAYEIAG